MADPDFYQQLVALQQDATASVALVYHRYGYAFDRFFQVQCGDNRLCAHDLTQELFMKLFENWPQVKLCGEPALRAMLKRYALNVLYRALRRDRAGRRDVARIDREVDPDSVASSPLADPARQAQSADAVRRLLQAIQRLTGDQRHALLLHLQGLSGAEIGQRLGGRSANAIHQLLARVRRGLPQGIDTDDCIDHGGEA